MPDLTEHQARAIADEYVGAAEAVSDFRIRKRAGLSTGDVLALQSLEHKLADQSDDFTAQAIQLTLDDLEQAVTAIVKITTGAREAIAKLEDIQRVVSIAANLVNLGDAIAAVALNPSIATSDRASSVA